MRNKVFFWSVTVALAGFLFGFDTVVISGANQPIKELWQTSPWFHGTFIMSMALWGTVFGALLGGIPTQKLGRKRTLFWIGILYTISALGSAFATDPYVFSFFRFIGGVGVGASSVAAPIYIAEITTPENRGRYGMLYQFNIVLGIFIAFISNYLLDGVGGVNDWRYMLGIEAMPALLYTVMVMGVSRSPRWLVLEQQNTDEALTVLEDMTNDKEEAKRMLADIQSSAGATTAGRQNVFVRKYRKPLLLAFLVAFFNQLSGINFILYYAPELLERAGLATRDSLGSSISIGLVNLIFTFVGIFLIDRLGRKQLLILGSIGYIISLSMVAYGYAYDLDPMFKLSFILTFVASHAIGQGAIIWVFISEIFPNSVRSGGQAFGTGTHWIFAALITLLTPVFLDADKGVFANSSPWPIFAFFAAFMVLQLIFAIFYMPETKGVSLEELQDEMGLS